MLFETLHNISSVNIRSSHRQ